MISNKFGLSSFIEVIEVALTISDMPVLLDLTFKVQKPLSSGLAIFFNILLYLPLKNIFFNVIVADILKYSLLIIVKDLMGIADGLSASVKFELGITAVSLIFYSGII